MVSGATVSVPRMDDGFVPTSAAVAAVHVEGLRLVLDVAEVELLRHRRERAVHDFGGRAVDGLHAALAGGVVADRPGGRGLARRP